MSDNNDCVYRKQGKNNGTQNLENAPCAQKISAALEMSTDYLLTGEIIDKDLLILSNKLRKLTPSQVRCIKNIIDECDTLFYTNEQKAPGN